MQLLIAAVGKLSHAPEAALVAGYLKKTRWDVVQLAVNDAPAGLPRAVRQQREAEMLRRKLPAQARLIAFDAGGKNVTSEAFCRLIGQAREQAVRHLAFVIGGQDGLAPDMLASAQQRIAFGGVTWPHQLLRAMLAEQIYRAYTITSGHPYHLGH